ncbi:helix-turn-helix transcriptional regulator [Brevibacillus sp. SYP-B805]|uniref:helix-turn-helix domain-containing protein n=1 Tax=Brevibacillus sp. SYP-B805 TaxID=1578199 RepID=UPI0013EC5127|nr:helix-turn-helix transcriptional regulator [Brevibacillus sp. SYP-B805]
MKRNGCLKNELPALRASRRWTQQELADRLGVSRQTIISIEANRYNPSLILAFEIARLFEVDINQVFQYEIREELS